LIQEDDENIELWYLVGVAALSILPIPDYEQAIFHLEQAKKMIEKLIEVKIRIYIIILSLKFMMLLCLFVG